MDIFFISEVISAFGLIPKTRSNVCFVGSGVADLWCSRNGAPLANTIFSFNFTQNVVLTRGSGMGKNARSGDAFF